MSVNGVGGAASLPMTLPSPAGSSAGTAGTSGTAGTTGSTSSEVRLPGQHRSTAAESAAQAQKETPKLAPLPPLRGLTVAEIRAMLGVASFPGQVQANGTTATTTPSIISASLDRYT